MNIFNILLPTTTRQCGVRWPVPVGFSWRGNSAPWATPSCWPVSVQSDVSPCCLGSEGFGGRSIVRLIFIGHPCVKNHDTHYGHKWDVLTERVELGIRDQPDVHRE